MTEHKTPTVAKALIPIIFLIGLLSFNVIYVFKDDAISGSNQMILLFAAAVGALVGIYEGYSWIHIRNGIIKSISSTVPAIIILLLIGALAGTWLLSGIVPAMIYYGLQILNPTIFLVATCIICSIVSVATGSSWSTVATVGIALFGIGQTLGYSEGMVAGAIISGAYFGDKISPLSDTTNLAAAMAGTELFTHIKFLMYTTVPSYVITLIIFIVIGLGGTDTDNLAVVQEVQAEIKSIFHISPWLFLVPVIVIGLIVKKMPAIPALFIGGILGGVAALLFQGNLIHTLLYPSESSIVVANYKAFMNALTISTEIPTENPMLESLLGSSGMAGMLNTVWLVLTAMTFGGVMESCGFLKALTDSLIKMAKSTASLITTTAATCFSVNALASDQYLAVVIPGRMYADIYKSRGIKPETLSRTLEDSGTVTSALIPWNTCGAYHAGVLGVATLTFAPFCFFNIISPFMTILFAIFNIKIARYTPEELDALKASENN